MEWIKDYTPMFMDIAKDAKGREAIEYGLETEEEYKDHLIRIVFEREEQRALDFLLLKLMEQFDMYIGNDEMTTLENGNVAKAIEISKDYQQKSNENKEVFGKFIAQLENALQFKSDVFFG
ncbi:hypothetical protein [Fibrobacter intestinalis]|uniref:Uncharacterized protein n=1 Tax=Fibrobacter intestinalis TaxID=28122 RepID=A0A1T4PZ61_9BACT|nr:MULTISPECIES: hypothetical protein [Fibrobacter]PBC72771.1 hypothetical protein BGW94_0349 [Fibrobacter sp. NR9]SJZ96729.1 hypothetical protein SAMN02745108_02104 [Fibrobacter intestinalis]